MEEIKICTQKELTTGLVLRLKSKKENSEYEYRISESVEKIIRGEVKEVYFFLRKRPHYEDYDAEAIFDPKSGEIYPLWMAPSGRIHLLRGANRSDIQKKYIKEIFQMLMDEEKV